MKEKNKKIEAEETTEGEEDVIVVQEGTKITDGMHNGQIKNIVHEKRQGFDYVDVYIDVEDDNGNYVTIKTGFPAYISQNSSLGRFLNEAGMELKPGDKVGLQKIKDNVIGRDIAFQTFTDDQFAKVLNKTIKFK